MVSKHNSPEKDVEESIEIEALRKLIQQRNSVFKRLPIVFTLLVTFGLAATFYGFQHIITGIPVLANNPYITLVIGLLVLLLTGTLYKKLG
jgi:hypothetical protein